MEINPINNIAGINLKSLKIDDLLKEITSFFDE